MSSWIVDLLSRNYSIETVEQILETASKDSLLYKFADAFTMVCLDEDTHWLKVKHLQNKYIERKETHNDGDK